MKASELRLGNLLQFLCEVVTVDSIRIDKQDGFKDCVYINGYRDGNLKPIPLTEEWLLKFGFVKDKWYQSFQDMRLSKKVRGQTYLLKNAYFSVSFGSGEMKRIGFGFGLDYDDSHPFELDVLKYVHQLQNLYFALTGEELTIKQ